MHNDTSTLKTVAFIQKGEKGLPGFRYKVRFCHDGLSDAIMFITAAVSKSIFSYGHIMFLDAQIRAFNHFCW